MAIFIPSPPDQTEAGNMVRAPEYLVLYISTNTFDGNGKNNTIEEH